MKAVSALIVSLLFGSHSFSAQAKPLVLGVISDLNGTECQALYPSNSIKAFDQLLANHSLDHIIMPGDGVHGECLSYKGKVPYQTVVKSMWEEFDKRFARKAHDQEGVSSILAPGNHDAPFLTSSSRETFRVENAEFIRYWQNMRPKLNVETVHAPGVKDNYPYYWAYTFENVLFVVLQSTRTGSLSNGVEQKRWLKALFQSPVARSMRAKIAFGHIPAYAVLDPSVGSKYKEIIEKEQVGVSGSLVDLLLDNGVNLLVTGHSHAPYPGELTRASDKKKLKILSMPCAHSPRKLYSKSAVAPRGYAVVEVSDENQISLSVHNYSDGKVIPASYFPSSIPMTNSKVTYRRMGEVRKK